jgi:hypothetical protein
MVSAVICDSSSIELNLHFRKADWKFLANFLKILEFFWTSIFFSVGDQDFMDHQGRKNKKNSLVKQEPEQKDRQQFLQWMVK